MVSDDGVAGPTRDCRVGGPSASMYFFMVALWIPNSRSIARSGIPLRPAFWIAFHLSLCLKECRLARRGGFGLAGGGRAAGVAPLILLVLDP